MAEIHHLVRTHGRDTARKMLPAQQNLVDLAADILSQESESFGITYSGFCLTALPHRKIPDHSIWNRRGHNLTLVVAPGQVCIGGDVRTIGIPYGSRARMILLYLQTRAVQTQSPEIELGRSMNDWLERMDLSIGGKTYSDIREQALRISACNLTFFWSDDQVEGFEKDSIVKGGIHLRGTASNPNQGDLWVDTVRLSDAFFRALKAHPVPIWEPALRGISNKSLSIDIYIWLAYRLHSLKRPTTISWTSVYEQFGAGFKDVYSFRQHFKSALKFALVVYPDAKVEVATQGLLLYPSRPPVEPRSAVMIPPM